MNEVAAECKTQKHHPEWTNVYNRAHIRWTTHNPKGMSSKDTNMARFCDKAAERFGEQELEGGQTKTDSQTMVAGDCCTPVEKAKA